MSNYQAICKVCHREVTHRLNGACEDCLRNSKTARTKATKARNRGAREPTIAEAIQALNEGKAYVRK